MESKKLRALTEDALFEEDGLTEGRLAEIVAELAKLPEDEALAYIAQTELDGKDKRRLEEAVKNGGDPAEADTDTLPRESAHDDGLDGLEQDALFEEDGEQSIERLMEELKAMPQRAAIRRIDEMDLGREEKQRLKRGLQGAKGAAI